MRIKKETEYLVKTNYDINYEKLADLTDTKNFIDGNLLYAVDLKIEESRTGLHNDGKTTRIQKIIPQYYLDQISDKPHAYEQYFNEYSKENTAPILLVKQEFIDQFSKYGLYDNNIPKWDDQPEVDKTKLTSPLFIKNGKNPDYQFIQFVPNEEHLKVIQDTKGQKYMEPFVFDYINGHLNNEKYHLEPLIEYLMTRSDISFVVDGNSFRSNQLLHAPLKGNEKGIDRIIDNIPGYNSEPGCDEFIQIVYRPQGDSINKILDWKVDQPNNEARQIWSVADFIVMDVLGCEKFMVSPPQAEPVIPKSKFKR